MGRILSLLFILSLLSISALAQLNADFIMTDLGGNTLNGGCQPLVVRFSDASTFNGSPVPYSSVNNGNSFNSHTWDFGLGLAGSNQQNPSIAYSSSDTVTVQLFLTNDGVNYDTASQQLVIHPRPVVNFSADVQSGCDSLVVNFTDLSTSGDLSIVDWTWDFSDGVISRDSNPTHTFILDPNTNQNCFNVTLIVNNSQGCNNSLTRNQFICIEPEPIPNFTVDNQLLCDTPYTFQFTDLSVSSNTLSYLWNFGDGRTSTKQNPIHNYTSEGVFNVRLSITDTTCGQAATLIRYAYIRTQSINAFYDFSPDSVCVGTPIRFTSNHQLSNGSIVSSNWDFGDNIGTSNQLNPTYTYSIGGLYTTSVTITDNYGCSDLYLINDSVLIYNQPDVLFNSNVTQSCKAPFEVDFFSTVSSDVQSYKWYFGDGDSSTQANPVHIYNSSGNFTVSLIVENGDGCTNTYTRSNWITIDPTIVNFTVDTNLGCIPLTVNFTNNSSSLDPVISYSWNFGDPGSGVANSSTLQNPTHIFNSVGTFIVELTIETQGGCIADYSFPISTGSNAFALFDINPRSVCVDEPVTLINNSTGNITSTLWDFGDNQYSNNPNEPNHSYEFSGVYDITLRVGDNGCFSDSTIQVTILDPSADFSYNVVCNTPGRVDFTSIGSGGTSFTWDFDDASTLGSGRNVSHIFSSPGTYNVELTVLDANTGCTDTQVYPVTISNNNVDFTSNVQSACAPRRIFFSNLSLRGLNYLWNFGDPSSSTNTSTGYNTSHEYQNTGTYTVSLTVIDQNGCQTTNVKNAYINLSNVISDFTASQTFLCFDSISSNTINFTDLSSSTPGSNITQWIWYFGDNTSLQYNLPGNPPPASVSHTYTSAGVYDVALVVVNNIGCRDSIMLQDYIEISNPIANFDLDYNLFCEGQGVDFNNRSTGNGLSYFWDFGDKVSGDNSINRNPNYIYSDTGIFTVSLSVVDIYGCSDTILVPNAVKVGTPSIDFVADDTFRYCPPHLVNFTNLTTYDTLSIASVTWNFGDNTFSNRINPSHIYTQAGLFDVSLYVEFVNGCSDSLYFPEMINVGGAVGTVDLSVDTGCAPLCISLKANSEGAITHYWLYGDGIQESSIDSVYHCYLNPGLFVPAVVLTDTQQPTCTYVLYSDDTLKVDSVITYFTSSVDTICSRDPIQFFDSSYAEVNNNFIAWFWDFGDGGTDTVQNPTYVFNTPGNNTVTLISVNSYGCSNIYTKDIFVWEKPTANFSFSDSTGCDTLFTVVQDQSVQGDAPIVDWFWDFDVHGIYNIQNPPPVVYTDTGTYSISLYVTDANGCIDTAVKTITVYPTPIGINGSDTIQLCLGDTALLSGTSGYSFYAWSPNIRISDTTIATPLVYPQDTITYQLMTVDSTGCFTVDYITIEVLPRPELYMEPYPDTAICFGDTVNLIASGSGETYIWQPRNNISNPLIANPYVYPTQTTTYTVTSIDSNSCRNYDSIRVFVNLFESGILAERTCLGDNTPIADITQTSDIPIVDWQWTISNPKLNPPLIFTDSSFVYLFSDSGYYQIDLILTDAIGCQDSLSTTLIIDHPTQPFAEQDTLICFGQSTDLRAGGAVEVFWTPAVFIDNDSSFTPIVSPEQSTQYIANLVNGVCPVGKDSVFITVIPTPFLEVTGDKEVIRGTSVEIEAFADNYESVYWTPSDSLTCPECLVTRAFPLNSTEYIVTVVDSFGCINEKVVLVEVIDRCDESIVFVPNTFTPNEDGRNDKLYARKYGAAAINYFRVFDRWGKLIFETDNENIGWDGLNQNGKKLNQGVYVYMVEAVCYSNETIIKTGNVTLLK